MEEKTNVHFKLVPVDYSKPYDEQPECKRHVIGAYANLARHNMTLAVNTIMQAIGMNTFSEENIEDAFGSGHCKRLLQQDNIEKVKLQQRLYRHFTFLKRMKLEDKEKKSVQLQTLIEVMADFTQCMADIRNFYTHYRPYNTQEEISRQLELQKKMGERLTFLFENSCQMFKKREKLKHEENEVFSTQREEVRYAYYWFVSQNLPRNMSWEQLITELKKTPNHKRKIEQIEYTLHDDGSVMGICRRNGVKQRYTWNFNEKRADEKSYDDLLQEINDEIAKQQKKYEEDTQKGKMNVSPVSTDSVRIGNVRYTLVGSKGIRAEWSQFDRNPDYYAAMRDPEKGLSDVGLLYFLCLFLDKKVAFELMEEVGFTAQCTFARANAGENVDILQELMCMNRIRMVKSKLDSEMTDTALALDMLNEVRKCPKQLYEVFGKEARAEFKDDATVDWEKANQREAVQTEEQLAEREDARDFEEVESSTDDDVEQNGFKETPKSTFVRWEDRFPQMALRYIDVRGLFEDIRFQLNLGKYRFAFYMHDSNYSVDGEERLRILQKELHGFGRIQEVDERMQDLWKDLFDKKYEKNGVVQKEPDAAGQTPYVTEQKPQYAIDEKSHSIGLRWEGWDNGCRKSDNVELISHHFGNKEENKKGLDKDKMFIPFLPAIPEKPTGDCRQKNQAEQLLPPQAMMSLYDLPALLFYQYLLEKYEHNHHPAEQAIKDCYDHLKTFLNDVSDGRLLPMDDDEGKGSAEQLTKLLREKYELRLNDIPEKLRKYLLKIVTDYDQKLKDSAYNRLNERKERIQCILESFREKKKRIGTKDNKFDKMHASIKTGALAQFLMRDIMDWLPLDSESRAKFTGQSYMALQAAMAMLGQEFEDENGEKRFMSLEQLRAFMLKAKVLDVKTDKIDQKRFHPFLHLVFRDCQNESLEQFYELYLEKEITKITRVIEFLDKANGSYAELQKRYRYIPFLHHERVRWAVPDAQAVRDLAKRYLERPLQLPDGLFTDRIYRFLQTIPQQQVSQKKWTDFQTLLKNAVEGEPHLRLSQNASYLINLYFNNIENDHSQQFYLTTPIDGTTSPYLHIYRVFKKFFGKPIKDTNQKTTPAYTIEEIHKILKDKPSIRNIIKAYVEVEVAKYRYQKERKFKKELKKYEDKQWTELKEELLPSGKRKWLGDELKKEVARRLHVRKEEFEQSIEQYRIRLTKKQERMIRKVDDNERAIRRFKTQDILLLIMARQILKAKSKDRDFESGFCLKYVMSDSLLDKPITFEWDVYVGKKENRIKKTVKQENMKMKDYGQFYKFLSDKKRLATLLSRLPQTTFFRAEIENEFSHYDSNRSAVFRLVYNIECEVYRLRPDLTSDANAEPIVESNDFYYNDNGKLKARRNNFLSLLKILAAGVDGILDEDEEKLMQSIRNSISHNTYEVDLSAVFEGRKDDMRVPLVADGIKDKMETQANELRHRVHQKTSE